MTGPDLIAVQRALDARHSKDAAQRESRRLCGLLPHPRVLVSFVEGDLIKAGVGR